MTDQTCRCDGAAFHTAEQNASRRPFLVNPTCPVHGQPDQTQRVFTATVEAMYADDLRETRDLTDAQIRGDFVMPIDDQKVAQERAKAATTRRAWEQDAINRAVSRVLLAARDAAERPFPDEDGGEPYYIATGDLDGATITITVADLVATATLTLPEPTGPDA